MLAKSRCLSMLTLAHSFENLNDLIFILHEGQTKYLHYALSIFFKSQILYYNNFYFLNFKTSTLPLF